MDNQALVNQLNDILVRNLDAAEGFIKVAQDTKNEFLGNYFRESSLERKKFAASLQREIQLLGQKPEHDTSVLSAAHRAWIDLKEKFTSAEKMDISILEEVIRGEEQAVKEYDELTQKEEVPANIKTIILDHKATIEDTLEHARQFLETAETEKV